MNNVARWHSLRPEACDICSDPFEGDEPFIDGKTIHGPWGIMCEACHRIHGVGLGTGRGQKYDSDLRKVEG